MTSIEFSCPSCGGSHYRQAGERAYECKGNDRRSCRFTWPRDESWRYFVMTTRRAFSSRAEYEGARVKAAES